jgi:hypothetical protein
MKMKILLLITIITLANSGFIFTAINDQLGNIEPIVHLNNNTYKIGANGQTITFSKIETCSIDQESDGTIQRFYVLKFSNGNDEKDTFYVEKPYFENHIMKNFKKNSDYTCKPSGNYQRDAFTINLCQNAGSVNLSRPQNAGPVSLSRSQNTGRESLSRSQNANRPVAQTLRNSQNSALSSSQGRRTFSAYRTECYFNSSLASSSEGLDVNYFVQVYEEDPEEKDPNGNGRRRRSFK